MPREYRHIKLYEKEIIELWEQGKSLREIAEMYGFTKEQVQEFKTRYNCKIGERIYKRVVHNSVSYSFSKR